MRKWLIPLDNNNKRPRLESAAVEVSSGYNFGCLKSNKTCESKEHLNTEIN